jgi:uncharacterized membrane protein YidH (DUF202 family)
MQRRPRLLLFLLLGVWVLAMAPERIGPYAVAATPAGIEVHAPDDSRAGSVLVAAGLGLAALGAWRARNSQNERRNFALARVERRHRDAPRLAEELARAIGVEVRTR